MITKSWSPGVAPVASGGVMRLISAFVLMLLAVDGQPAFGQFVDSNQLAGVTNIEVGTVLSFTAEAQALGCDPGEEVLKEYPPSTARRNPDSLRSRPVPKRYAPPPLVCSGPAGDTAAFRCGPASTVGSNGSRPARKPPHLFVICKLLFWKNSFNAFSNSFMGCKSTILDNSCPARVRATPDNLNSLLGVRLFVGIRTQRWF